MQITEVKTAYNDVVRIKEKIMALTDFDSLKAELKALEQLTYATDFWNDQTKANKVIMKIKNIKKKVDQIQSFIDLFEEIEVTNELLEIDESLLPDFDKAYKSFVQKAEKLEIELLLTEDNDALNAILEIHPGAGGTESQDWAEMLYRMYSRYAESNDYKIDVLDYQAGDEAGIKSITFTIIGINAYGYLKAEHGVHRLVRISPFDSGGRRHTSFASVNVIPEFNDEIDIEIDEKDLKIDTYRSSGAGGQSVNTTDSAVRITHIPSHIVVTVQNERSQIKNREKAMQILKGKLYQKALIEQQEAVSKYRSSDVSNSFGSQIRSYVMHPYSMVKDHRTNIETGNVSKVMDGDIDMFIKGFLTSLAKEDNNG
jgi:peptide chain release factor 2